jgi:aminoglycoside phosphotransferase (APT) family kinase protein
LEVAVNGQEQVFVLQLDARGLEYEYRVLKALEPLAIPTPHAYGLDVTGESLGVPCFFSDFITGESLLKPMLAGETWAEEVYLDAVCALQSVSPADLGEAFSSAKQESAVDILADAWAYFKDDPQPLAETIYQKLSATKPEFPPLRFSNGDLWLENFMVQDKKLAGVIDFQGAAFSDPIFEFLLSFFVEPGLLGRGIEVRYCQRIGVNPAVLHRYHGLEFFDTWRWVLSSGRSFVHHIAESLENDIKNWLQTPA